MRGGGEGERGRLPAAEEAAGDCSLGLHLEHVSARCNDLHAMSCEAQSIGLD